MAVNLKMGVDIGNFTAGIRQGQQILKGLNAEMKASEAEFKATGDAEKKLSTQTKTLNSQLNVQKGIADQAKKALKAMTDAGIDPADEAYQKLYVQLLNAEAGANEAAAALKQLGGDTAEAADGADKLGTSLSGISKKMSLDQVISGIDRITSGLESAASKAINLGEELFSIIMNSAQWADDTETAARMYGISVERYEQMQKLVKGGLDTSLEDMLKSQQKFNKNIGEGSDEFNNMLIQLGLAKQIFGGKSDEPMIQLVTDDQLDLFFRAGQAIMAIDDAYEQEAASQKLFGKGWRELISLFTDYKSVEEYNAALQQQNVVSEELVQNGVELSDSVGELVGNWETLRDTVLLSLAPGLTEVANSLNDLLKSVLEYLQTEEGQQMLEELSQAVTDLFSGLKDVSAQDIVNGFKQAFDTVLDVLDWIVKNKDTLIGAVEGIFGVWATLEVSSGVLTILKVIDGLKSLAGLGTGAVAATATGLGTWLTGAVTNAAGFLADPLLQNSVPAFGDWFVHNTPIGQEYILGTKEKGSWGKEISENAETFAEDWKNNNIYKFFESGVETIRQNVENTLKYWQEIDKMNQTAAEWTLGDEYTSDELMQMIQNGSPVPVEVEPTPEEGAAEKVAEQVGTVVLPVDFQIRSDYANISGYIRKMMGYANGLPYVPNEGLYHLHRGERVVPAREVASRSYNSNLYVESMYMNGGTDAAGLAAAMAAAQRRQMSGYGS